MTTKQINEACAKWQKRLDEGKTGKYTAEQIHNTIKHWRKVCEDNDDFDEIVADDAYRVLKDAGFDIIGVTGDQTLCMRLDDPEKQEATMNAVLKKAGYDITASVDFDDGDGEYTVTLNVDEDD